MKQLISILNDKKISYIENEPMSAHTTFKIGGKADIYITVDSTEELSSAIKACKACGMPYMILGNGSNLLVSDDGIEGAVIVLDGTFKDVTVEDGVITAGAGAKLSRLCVAALENGMSGIEFAYGIPGTVGGAVFMNAGAYGGEIKDVVASVTALNARGETVTYPAEALELGYRTSVFKKNGEIILFAAFKLHQDSAENIKARMDDFMDRRKTKQPLEYPSAGSVFKRPEGAFVGALIEQCGLKGHSIGGAQVSEKHAGFIINTGGASCKDVMDLVALIQQTVKTQTGYDLEQEIIRTGR